MHALRWDGWTELDADARLASARSVIATLRQEGLDLGEPALHAFGPPDERWTLAVIRDERTGVVFSLAACSRYEWPLSLCRERLA